VRWDYRSGTWFVTFALDDAVASKPRIKRDAARRSLKYIGIRADFWQPQKNERKAESIKYWHQRAVLDRMNIQISKKLHTTMSWPFYSDAKKAKNVSFFFFFFFFFFFVTLFISTRFLRNYCR